MDGARMVARGVLDALVFLHNKGVSHSHLLDSTVFMDNAGNIRCTDFSLVPSLLELIGGAGQSSSRGDLPALGLSKNLKCKLVELKCKLLELKCKLTESI